MTLTMQDAAGVGQMTSGFDVWAGYIDRVPGGHTATYPTAIHMAQQYKGRALSVTTDSDWTADIFDIEAGAESLATADTWFAKRTTARPIFYISVSSVDTLVAELTGVGVDRHRYRILSAHYGDGEHICGPTTCGLCKTPCDGTQWAGTVNGPGTQDVSVLLSTFFLTEKDTPRMITIAAFTLGTQKEVFVSVGQYTTPTHKVAQLTAVYHWWQSATGTTKWHVETLPGPA